MITPHEDPSIKTSFSGPASSKEGGSRAAIGKEMSGDASVVRAGESLVTGAGRQLALIDVDADGVPAAAYERVEQRGRFTGERLFFTNDRLYNAVVKLLARALPYREIAEICEVSINTVCGVAYREGVPIETLRARIARTGMVLAQLTQEAAVELLNDPNARAKLGGKELMVMHGIAFNNAQLASGGATHRIEMADITPPGHDDYLAALRNVTRTGLSGEIRATKEPAPGDPDGPVIEVGGDTEEDHS